MQQLTVGGAAGAGGRETAQMLATAEVGLSVRRSDRRHRLGRPFWGLWSATTVSAVGDGAALVALPLLAVSLTGDARLVALVAVMQRLPWLVVAPFTGLLADLADRRRLVVAAEAVRTALFGALAAGVAAHFHPLACLYATAFLVGCADTTFSAAGGALTPELVDSEDLGRANGYLQATRRSGEGLTGPAIGGVLAAVALSLPLVVDGFSFAVSGLLLATVLPKGLGVAPMAANSGSGASPSPTPRRRSLSAELRQGMRWFRASGPVRSLSVYVAGLAFCQAAVFGVMALWASRDLHLSRIGYGLFLAAVAVGGVIGGGIGARWGDRLPVRRVLVLAGLLAAAGYLVAGTTTAIPVAAAALGLEAGAVLAGNSVGIAARQRLIPRHLLGRVGNVVRLCIFGSMSVGAAAGGFLASVTSLRFVFIAAAGLQLVVVAVWGSHLGSADEPAHRPVVVHLP
ncbi:MAG TPA: MFS transporter [Acidimicrobiales bacterium]|nr:MFS transporter [Acidimicrobiales bacterium]